MSFFVLQHADFLSNKAASLGQPLIPSSKNVIFSFTGDDQMERKGQVLILLVEQALSFQDYKAASMHCQELMSAGEVTKWGLCGVMVVEILIFLSLSLL